MVCKLQTVCVVPSFFCPAIEPMLPTRSNYGCILYSNTLCIIQDFRTEAAARRLRHGLRLLISAAAHRVRSVRAGYYGSTRRARWPGHKPICIDRDGADLGIDCCTQLDQPKSRLYAARRALSAESPQQSAVVAYSRDFGLRPGQAVNRVPAGR
eukprot:SAG25_NODE_604_length_6583_cov_11.931431_7_plen_154_part_00